MSLALVLTFACGTPDFLSEEKLRAYINDESNNLAVSKQIGNTTMKLTYRPVDFLRLREIKSESDSAGIKQAMKLYNNYTYFVLQLSSGGKDALYGLSADQQDFSEKLQTLSFRMNQYVQLVTSNADTIPLADAHYTRTFGMSTSSDILMVFNNEKIVKTDWLSISFKDFGFKTGNQSFRFETKKINATPKLEELRLYYDLTE